MYLNKAIIIGNLTRDPEMKALPSGNKVCSFGIATNRVWKDKNGVKQELADFHNIVVFGRQAEIVAQYLRKGANVLVEGRIQNRSWDDKDGQKKYRSEIVADTIQFGPKSGGSSYQSAPGAGNTSSPSATASSPASTQSSAGASVPASAQMDTIEYPEEEINPDDIPF